MGMYESLNDIMKTFYHDETLLRLLYYSPTNYSDIPDPLDDSLQNVIDLDEDWSIREDRIMSVPKSDDLVDNEICRIYVYAGRRRPVDNGYIYANQEIIIDILCHISYEKDLRSTRISDRLDELLLGSRVSGFGKISYINGTSISSPEKYIGYSQRYEVGNMK